jgi:hypothetical protein
MVDVDIGSERTAFYAELQSEEIPRNHVEFSIWPGE